MVKFRDAQEAVPQLKNLSPTVDVVIIGYLQCPHSRKSVKKLKEHPEWKKTGRAKFVAYDRGSERGFRERTGHQGTFPVIFVRDNDGNMEYIGGGDQFLQRVDQESRPSFL